MAAQPQLTADVQKNGPAEIDALTFPTTDSSGTPGAATINKTTGKVSVASGQSSVVVTNSYCGLASIPMAQLLEADGAITVANCVPAAGSFTINLTANATGDRTVGFVVLNPA